MTFYPIRNFLEAWRGGHCGLEADLTATDLLDVMFPVGGKDFEAIVLLELVFPEDIPGRDGAGTEEVIFVPDAIGTEEVVIVPVAVIVL